MKKNTKWIIPAIFIIIIGGLIYSFSKNEVTTEEIVEYSPSEEISDEQLQRAKIKLYYLNKNTNEIIKDENLINTKNLIENPAKSLLEFLSESTPLQDTISPITKDIKINNVTISKNIAEIDLSSNFLDNNLKDAKQEELLITCIANTLCQLNEINSIKILIDGEHLEKTKLGLNLNQNFLPNYSSHI